MRTITKENFNESSIKEYLLNKYADDVNFKYLYEANGGLNNTSENKRVFIFQRLIFFSLNDLYFTGKPKVTVGINPSISYLLLHCPFGVNLTDYIINLIDFYDKLKVDLSEDFSFLKSELQDLKVYRAFAEKYKSDFKCFFYRNGLAIPTLNRGISVLRDNYNAIEYLEQEKIIEIRLQRNQSLEEDLVFIFSNGELKLFLNNLLLSGLFQDRNEAIFGEPHKKNFFSVDVPNYKEGTNILEFITSKYPEINGAEVFYSSVFISSRNPIEINGTKVKHYLRFSKGVAYVKDEEFVVHLITEPNARI